MVVPPGLFRLGKSKRNSGGSKKRMVRRKRSRFRNLHKTIHEGYHLS